MALLAGAVTVLMISFIALCVLSDVRRQRATMTASKNITPLKRFGGEVHS